MELGMKEHQQQQLLWYGDYDPAVTQTLLAQLSPGAVFMDIGANLGFYSLVAASAARNIQVLAMEPSALLFAKLQRQLSLNPQYAIRTFRLAAGNANEEKTLYGSSEENQGMSSLRPPENHSGESEIVSVVRIDDWSPVQALDRLDLVKIDTEGHEIAVIQGMVDTIKKWRPRLLVEVNPQTLSMFGHQPDELIQLLQNLDYVLYTTGKVLQPITAEPDWQTTPDILCIPR